MGEVAVGGLEVVGVVRIPVSKQTFAFWTLLVEAAAELAITGLPWGGGFGAEEGDVLFFNNTRNANATEWVSVIEKNCGEASATNSFPIADKVMDDAPFAAELYGAWDFGPLVFEDVVLVSLDFPLLREFRD